MFDRLIQLLTSNYKKDKESNIGKLFLIITDELDEVRDNLNKIEEYRDVDSATGKTLDKIGSNIRQFRGVSTDEIYRLLIKYKLRGISSTGDINEIISIITDTLEVDPSEIQIEELYNSDDYEPAALRILSVPLSRLNEIGLSSNQFIQILKLSIPAGVRLAELRLEGTFEFSDVVDDYDNNKGFGDLMNPETGGTLGATFSSDKDVELPI